MTVQEKMQVVFEQFNDPEMQTLLQSQSKDLNYLVEHLEHGEVVVAGITGQVKQAVVLVFLTNLHIILLRHRMLLKPWLCEIAHQELTHLSSSSGIAFTRIELDTNEQAIIINAVNNEKAYQFITKLNQLIATLENDRIMAQRIGKTSNPDFFENEKMRLDRLHDHGIINDLDYENSKANLYFTHRNEST
ncbi:hypothetical protein JOC36_001058 [Weissella uvarum]|uniref:PH domain-containing protein n=1 Tax=Weissella uvarum TaxID=1479233 RepID=UPI0019608C14|nr:PH domain-containing protein [Weissella uvarum]MBM7617501.1 hypothetical protein [Weissella uvarum]MCM0595615.1 PH domain-containing protein [Weissella uvarum]